MGDCHCINVVSDLCNVFDLLGAISGGQWIGCLRKTVAFKRYPSLRVTEIKPKASFVNTRVQWYCSFVLCLATAGTFPARGESHRLGRVPAIPTTSGLAVDVSMEAVGGQGYQPLYLDVRPAVGKRFNRDRRIDVTISPRNAYSTAIDFDYHTELFLSESASSHEQTVLVPYYYPWDELTIHLTEEGENLTGGQRTFLSGQKLRTSDTNQAVTVGVLLPQDSKRQNTAWEICPDVRGLVTVLGQGPLPNGKKRGASIPRLDHQTALSLLHEVQPAFVQFRPIKEDRLPSRWLEYSQLDLLLIPSPLLNRIWVEQPQSFQAIVDWIATGGSVWVYATNTEAMTWISSDQITKLPSGQVAGPAGVKRELSLQSVNDISQLTKDYEQEVVKESKYSNNTFRKRSDAFTELADAKHPLATMEHPTAVANRIGYATYGLGMVIAIADDDPFPGSFQFWQAVVGKNSLDQLTWKQRVGVEMLAGNVNYWNWLIPAVGQPPVKSFIFLNAFLALLIGPVSYFYFRRKQRLYLLYFFAPLTALFATIGLFLYALISDGTESMVRVQQLTWLDIPNAQMAYHDRQTYFPVMAKEPGISVQSDVAFFPVHHSPSGFHYGYNRQQSNNLRGDIVVSGTAQSFRGVFFSPRRQRQYISVGVTQNGLTDKIAALKSRPEDAVISSAFPFDIDQLVVRDTQGQYWVTQKLASGGNQKMLPSNSSAVVDSLTPFRPPPAEVPKLQQTYWAGLYGQSTGSEVNLMERRFKEWGQKGMPAGSFLAITPIDTDRVGLQKYRLVDSVHVVMGLLP